LPGIIDIAFRERIHPRLAAFQVALIIFIQTVALRRNARGVGLASELAFKGVDTVQRGHQVGLQPVDRA
jgi:hypothetical protein